MTAAHSVDRYVDAYGAFTRGASGPVWMVALRQSAIDYVSQTGLPSTKDEDWKYTNVSAVSKLSVNLPTRKPGTITLSRLAEQTYVADGARLVFVNGMFAPELSSAELEGVTITTFAAAYRSHGELIEAHLGKHTPLDANTFAALNTAFIRDGALVVIPAGLNIEKPIQLLFVSHSSDGGTFSSPRILVLAGKNSRATIVEHHVALTPASYFSNSVAEIVCEEGAQLDHYCVQEESVNAFHIGTTTVEQYARSQYRSCAVMTGGRLTRNTIKISVLGEECTTALDGLYIAEGRQHVDNHTVIDHTAPNCSSRQLYKGILNGQSRAVFNGKIFVRHEAQKTDAQQKNNNLVLSDEARVDTKPQLEIFADDVKCTHGATVGQIDDASLFYLKTRGIGESLGRRLLTYGFAHEILERIALEPLRARLDARLLMQVEHDIV